MEERDQGAGAMHDSSMKISIKTSEITIPLFMGSSTEDQSLAREVSPFVICNSLLASRDRRKQTTVWKL